jgi:DNA-binding transcriptional LysR family regulator
VVRSAIALYASRPYLSRRGPPTEKRLAGHDAVLPSGELGRLPEARWLKAQGVRASFSSNSYPALVAAAIGGAGVVALSDAWGQREPALTRLFQLPFASRGIWLVATAVAVRRPAVKVVMARLAELLGKASGAPGRSVPHAR